MGLKARIDYLVKHNKVANRVFIGAGSAVLRFVGFFIPIKENAILFSSLSRKYNDSPKEIYETMIRDPLYKDMEYYWAVDDINTQIPGKHKIIKCDTMGYFIISQKCKYWVTCVNIERGLHYKKRKTRYLNTWHGTPIKSISGDDLYKNNFSYIDIFCCSGSFEREVFKHAFSVPDEHLLFSGLPRNDALYHYEKELIPKIKRKINIPDNKKVILYAPTWRDSNDGGKTYSVKPPINIAKWKKELSQEYVVLFRTHPNTNKLMGIEFDDFVIDVTKYPQINDLLIVSDILISDYSATIFDYSILERPIISFAYDYNEYKSSRGFEVDPINVLGENVLFSEDDVLKKIENMSYKEECRKVQEIKNQYLEYGGNATRMCIEALLSE